MEQDINDEVVGILMPFGGLSLELLSISGPEFTASASGSRDIDIPRAQLRDLACGVRELTQVGVVHGDINERNTLQKPDEVTAAEAFQRHNHLILVDFGDMAPEYKTMHMRLVSCSFAARNALRGVSQTCARVRMQPKS